MNDRVFAESVNYWQTSHSSPDQWIDKAKRQIVKLGGHVLGEGFGSDANGRAAFMLAFEAGGDTFKVVWPVLPTKSGKTLAARRQAATMLYHDVKAKCISAAVLGTRAAFFSYLMLPDGRTTTEASAPELQAMIPQMLAGPPQLELDPDVYDVEAENG